MDHQFPCQQDSASSLLGKTVLRVWRDKLSTSRDCAKTIAIPSLYYWPPEWLVPGTTAIDFKNERPNGWWGSTRISMNCWESPWSVPPLYQSISSMITNSKQSIKLNVWEFTLTASSPLTCMFTRLWRMLMVWQQWCRETLSSAQEQQKLKHIRPSFD